MFLAQLATSSYFVRQSTEYGVGALTIASSIVTTDLPPTTDTALQTWIAAHVGVDWPANDTNTMYTVFLPAGTSLTASFGASCIAFGGFHEETPDGTIVYALLPRCDDTIDTLTLATSHEILEGATDPHPYTNPAFNVADDEDVMWDVAPGSELGDMCEYADSVRQRLVGNFLVQRTWSNQSGAAGHDPCVPALQTPYVNATANLTDVAADFGGTVVQTRGIQVPIGTTKVIELDLFSDVVAPNWTVQAFDVGAKYYGHAELQLALDKPAGHNGDKLQLTITRTTMGTQYGYSEIELVSIVNGVTIGTWWVLVT